MSVNATFEVFEWTGIITIIGLTCVATVLAWYRMAVMAGIL